MSPENRANARALAREFLDRGDPTGWFEALYSAAGTDATNIPWADQRPNPNLTQWLAKNSVNGAGKRAITVGCGLGDDAEELARVGFDVTAFDVAPRAIEWCRERFPQSRVKYVVADLLNYPPEWRAAFDFVHESYTLQSLPPTLRLQAIDRVASLLAPRGQLLVICRARDASDPEGELPWPLTKSELERFQRCGLIEESFEDYLEDEDPPVRRFRAVYRRASNP